MFVGAVILAGLTSSLAFWNLAGALLTILLTLLGAKKLWGDVWRQNAEGYKNQVDELTARVAELERLVTAQDATIKAQSEQIEFLRNLPAVQVAKMTALLEHALGPEGNKTDEAYDKINQIYDHLNVTPIRRHGR